MVFAGCESLRQFLFGSGIKICGALKCIYIRNYAMRDMKKIGLSRKEAEVEAG